MFWQHWKQSTCAAAAELQQFFEVADLFKPPPPKLQSFFPKAAIIITVAESVSLGPIHHGFNLFLQVEKQLVIEYLIGPN